MEFAELAAKDWDLYKKVITKNWRYFLKDLDPTLLLDYLIEKELLDEIQYEDISALSSRSDKIRKILGHILQKGPQGYDKFKKSLIESSQEHLVQAMEDTEKELMESRNNREEPMEVSSPDSPDETDVKFAKKDVARQEELIYKRSEEPSQKHDKVNERGSQYATGKSGLKLTDQDLSFLANKVISGDMELLAPYLGVDSVDIKHIVRDNRGDNVRQIFKTLDAWRLDWGSDATLEYLRSALKASSPSVYVNWTKFEELENRKSALKSTLLPAVSRNETSGSTEFAPETFKKLSSAQTEASPSNLNQNDNNSMPSLLSTIPGELGVTRVIGNDISNSFQPVMSSNQQDTRDLHRSIIVTGPESSRGDFDDIYEDGADIIDAGENLSMPEVAQKDREPTENVITSIEECFANTNKETGRFIILNQDSLSKMKSFCSEKLATGGYGDVYRSRDNIGSNLGIKLVMKEIVKKDHSDIEKMRSVTNEKLASRTKHFGIVPLFAYGEEIIAQDERHFYFITPYMENGDLNKAIEDDQNRSEPAMTPWIRTKIMYQVASALDFLHTPVKNFREKILHRDIKTLNIVLDLEYNARLIDFGLAREMADGSDNIQTSGSRIVSTRGYFEVQDYRTLDVYADYFNFGVVIRELLTGRKPYYEKTEEELKRKSEKWIKKHLLLMWKDGEEYSQKLIKLSDQCLQSPLKRNLDSASILKKIQKMKDFLFSTESTKADVRDKCDLCMQCDAVDEVYMPHDKACKMSVCVSCMRHSYCNPIICCSCGNEINPPIGYCWDSVLIAGNDLENEKLARVFSDDIDEVKKVITSKTPLVMGVSVDRVTVVKPDVPGTSTTLKPSVEKVLGAFMTSHSDEKQKTLLLYFSGHHDSNGFQLGNNKEYLKIEELQNLLLGGVETVDKDVRLIVLLDCCGPPSIEVDHFKSMHDNIAVIQLNASRPTEPSVAQTQGNSLLDYSIADGRNVDGSIFRWFFTLAFTGRAFSETCFKVTGKRNCTACGKMADDFVTIDSLQVFIEKHYSLMSIRGIKTMKSSRYAGLSDSVIGYTINFPVDLEFYLEMNGKFEKVTIPHKLISSMDELRIAVFDKFKETWKLCSDGVGPCLNTCYFSNILYIYVKLGPKLKHEQELETLDAVINAWEGRREMFVSMRHVDQFDAGVGIVGALFESSVQEVVEYVLKKGTKQEFHQTMECSVDIQQFCEFLKKKHEKVFKLVEDLDEKGEDIRLNDTEILVRFPYDKDSTPKYRRDFLSFHFQTRNQETA